MGANDKIDAIYNPRRRVVDGRVEIYIRCPNLCHGFGMCSYCGNRLGYWRRPSPRYIPFALGRNVLGEW